MILLESPEHVPDNGPVLIPVGSLVDKILNQIGLPYYSLLNLLAAVAIHGLIIFLLFLRQGYFRTADIESTKTPGNAFAKHLTFLKRCIKLLFLHCIQLLWFYWKIACWLGIPVRFLSCSHFIVTTDIFQTIAIYTVRYTKSFVDADMALIAADGMLELILIIVVNRVLLHSPSLWTTVKRSARRHFPSTKLGRIHWDSWIRWLIMFDDVLVLGKALGS
jgi:hypothetical protein